MALEDARTLCRRFDPKATEYATIDLQTFQQMLAWVRGARLITVTALTVPDYRKTKCPFKNDVVKLARVNGVVNFLYEQAVNRQRVREGSVPDFEALPRQWGTRLHGLPFVSHVTKAGEHKLYLELKPQHVYGVQYFRLDGTPLETEEVKPFLAEKKENPKQGVEHEVLVRDYSMDNLLSAVMDGKGYVIQ